MKSIKLSSSFINLLQNMYNQIECRVNMAGKLTNSFKSNVGTRQGCPLSSTLFNIYLNDIPGLLKSGNCKPVRLDTVDINCLMYADDLVILNRPTKRSHISSQLLQEVAFIHKY